MKKIINISILILLFSNLFAQVDFEHVGSLYDFWGPPQQFQVYGDYAYVGIGSSGHYDDINIYNISHPDNITFVKRWTPEYRNMSALNIYDNYMYINSGDYLLIYDLADPTTPALVNEMENGPYWTEYFSLFEDQYLYQGNFVIWDFSDPVNPVNTFEQTPYIDQYGEPLAKFTDIIYFKAYHYKFGYQKRKYYLLDVSDPSAPVNLGECDKQMSDNNSLQEDSLNYDCGWGWEGDDWGARLIIKNFADPFNPVEIVEFWEEFNGGENSVIFCKKDNYIFIQYKLNEKPRLAVINVVDPANPIIETSISLQHNYQTSYNTIPQLQGNFIYAMSDSTHLGIIDITDPLNPVEISKQLSEDPDGGPLKVLQISGNYAFLAKADPQHTIETTIRIADVSDPENLIEIGSFDLVGSVIRLQLHANGNYLYASFEDFDQLSVNRKRLCIYDISDPVNPILMSNSRMDDKVEQIVFHGGYLYVIYNSINSNIYDVSDPSNPSIAYTYPEKLTDICFDSNLMYDGSLSLWDVTNPLSPVKLGTANVTVGSDIKYRDGKIFGELNSNIRIHDVSNFPNVSWIGTYESDEETIFDYSVDDNYAYLATYNGTQVVDIIDPANPVLAAEIIVPGYTNNSIEIVNNYIYTANNHSFDVYELQLPLPPEAFSLISPEGTIDTTFADLLWQSTTDPNGPTPNYDVWLSTTADFSGAIKVAENISDTTFQVSELLVGQTYYWKVRATDDNTSGTWSSTTLSFTVESAKPSLNFLVNIGGETKGGATLLDENTIYVASTSDIVRLNSDGSIEYTLNVNGEIKSSSTITSDHTVYIASTDNNLYSFNSNGVTNPNWPVALGAQATASVAVGPENNLYIGTSNGIFQAISREGAILWSFNVGAAVYSSSVISESGVLYVINENGRLYAFDLNTIDPDNVNYKWRLEIGESVKSSPALDGNKNLFITSSSGKLFKVKDDGTSGSIEWTFDSGGNCQSSPVIDSELTVYFCGNNGKAFAVNGQNGELIWDSETYYSQSDPDAILQATPALSGSGDELYIGDTYGVLYSLATQTGNILWSYIGEGIIEGPILCKNGNILYCANGQVFSLSEPDVGKTALSKKTTAPLWPTFQGNSQRTGYNGEYDPIGLEHDNSEVPVEFFVSNNYPNPFNPSTVFSVGLPQSSNLDIFIYNLLGQKVASIANGRYKAGVHQFTFNAKDLPSGTYFMQVFVEGKMNKVQKMMLLR
ncbi:MAG: PQQ-binding-like beta-propeller repeat protein [Calditrichaeota bacterium]|nr:PQQ-binding-like beta-propeller repeat protein [Calditrichota bacterium]